LTSVFVRYGHANSKIDTWNNRNGFYRSTFSAVGVERAIPIGLFLEQFDEGRELYDPKMLVKIKLFYKATLILDQRKTQKTQKIPRK
jgi:hypothetical protein